MDNILLYNKLANLPEHLKTEVANFIDFLLSKNSPQKPPVKKPKFGSAKGVIKMKKNFDDPIDDFKDYR